MFAMRFAELLVQLDAVTDSETTIHTIHEQED
jgi:hypothetical protein